jgi:hypothetical protein
MTTTHTDFLDELEACSGMARLPLHVPVQNCVISGLTAGAVKE